MAHDIKFKAEGFLQVIDLISGTKLVNETFSQDVLLSEFRTEQVRFNANEEKNINLGDLENISGLFFVVLDGDVSVKFDPASTVYIGVTNLLLTGNFANLIIKAGSVGATVKFIVLSKKV